MENLGSFDIIILGLVILLGLLQILYYPIQLYNLPTKYIYLSTFGLFGVIGILSLFKFKKLIKFIKGLKRLYKEILFGLLMFGVFCFIYYYSISSSSVFFYSIFPRFFSHTLNCGKCCVFFKSRP